MTLIAYETYNPRGSAREMIDRANSIIEERSREGYTLTLRQLFYQFVSRNWIANSEKSYNRLKEIMSKARLGGHVSWEAIEDRGRGLLGWGFDETPEDVLRCIEYELSLDLWRRQPNYVEAWVEKDALINVLSRPCGRLKVPHMSCKGYLSLSEGWSAGNRFRAAKERGQNCVLIYLGDHDPSGVDMTGNHRKRQTQFAGGIEVRRLALNMDQVEQYKPPPNPTKPKDSRSPGYIAEFGRTCWELDALEPSVIDELVTAEVNSLRDEKVWAETLKEQEERRRVLKQLQHEWPVVDRFLKKKLAR